MLRYTGKITKVKHIFSLQLVVDNTIIAKSLFISFFIHKKTSCLEFLNYFIFLIVPLADMANYVWDSLRY